MHLSQLALVNNLMSMDGLIISVLGLLFFGRRLPEVGKNLRQNFWDFPNQNPIVQTAMVLVVLIAIVILLDLIRAI